MREMALKQDVAGAKRRRRKMTLFFPLHPVRTEHTRARRVSHHAPRAGSRATAREVQGASETADSFSG